MKSLKSGLVIWGSVGLVFLGACSSNSNQAANSNTSPADAKPAESASPKSAKTDSSGQAEWPPKGGQVVESGKYHLQFVPEKEDKGTHLDFYLLKDDNHEPIPNAKVTAQIQMPDGTQKPLNLTYDPEGKHYTALLPEKAAGQYQVKIISDVNGAQVNGRFNFNI